MNASKAKHPPGASPTAILTRRQTQLLRLIADGYLTREIARLLRISRKTAEKHRQSLMDKLDIHEVASLTRYAVSSGAVPSNLPIFVPSVVANGNNGAASGQSKDGRVSHNVRLSTPAECKTQRFHAFNMQVARSKKTPIARNSPKPFASRPANQESSDGMTYAIENGLHLRRSAPGKSPKPENI
jgi:DNA-binding CsgD family transcriptional regulator